MAALALTLCGFVSPASALVATQPGADPETEAAVQAYNDTLLSGPAPGQSAEEWTADVQAKHDAVFGHYCDFSEGGNCFDYSVGTDATTPNLGLPVDFCNGTSEIWPFTADKTMTMAEAIKDPSVRDYAGKMLAMGFVWGLLEDQADRNRLSFEMPTAWQISCVKDKVYPGLFKSVLTVTLPVWAHIYLDPPLAKPINIANPVGSVTFTGTMSSRRNNDASKGPAYYWCVALNAETYSASGFGAYEGAVRRDIDAEIGNGVLCSYGWPSR